MLKYRIVRNLLILLLAGLIAFNFYIHVSWFWWFILILPFVSIFTWGSMQIRSGFYLPVLNKASHSNNVVSITFDDGPDPLVTPKLIEVLDKYEVKATFFCIGKHIKGNEEIIKSLHEKGHLVANHTFSHKWFLPFLPGALLKKDIQKTNVEIENILGVKPLLFRPPFGVTSPPYASAIKNLGYKTIGWSIRSLDTVIDDPDKLFRKVIKEIRGGDIILFHDNREKIVPFIDNLLNHLKKNGINVVPVDELLNIKGYEA